MPQLVGRPEAPSGRLLHNRAVMEDRHAVGHAQSKLDIMRDEQHSPAAVGKGAQVIEGMDGQFKVEARRGLVGNDELGRCLLYTSSGRRG